MKRIVYTRPDGGVSIVIPAISIEDEGLTEEKAVARALARLAKDVPNAADVQVVEPESIPARTFRDAWKADLSVDMAKAREIHRNRIRAMRAPLLADLDVAFMRAVEKGDSAAIAAIAAKKQGLRDAPSDPAIETAKTPEELSLVVPAAMTDLPL